MTADGIQIAGEGEDGSSATYYLGGCMPGCTDAEACNYDDMANVDDGSCLELDVCGDCGGTGYAACIDPEADNYDEGACVDDGSCIYIGCTDPEADNYDPQANQDPVAVESGLNISLSAGSWPGETSWTLGDLSEGAPFDGFVALAPGTYTISGSDSYGDGWNGAVMTITDAASGDEITFAVEESEGSIEVEVTGSDIEPCYYLGCTDLEAANFDATATVDDGSCIYPGCTDAAAANYDSMANEDDGSCIYPGCTDAAASNYDSMANEDDGSCIYPGCTDAAAANYDSMANEDDGSCIYPGCTDASADNYDSMANEDDGSCEWMGCMDGSLNSLGGYNACNYDPIYNVEGECEYPEASEFISIVDGEAVVELVIAYDCDGNALPEYDLDGNGVPDALEAQGCTDPAAANYNGDANVDDGSCLYAGCIYMAACNYDMDADIDNGSCVFDCLLTGCTDAGAINYDSAATMEDGSCLFPGCQDEEGLNYDASANYPGECIYLEPCPGDFTGDGEVDVNDLLDFFQLWGNECPWIPGFED